MASNHELAASADFPAKLGRRCWGTQRGIYCTIVEIANEAASLFFYCQENPAPEAPGRFRTGQRIYGNGQSGCQLPGTRDRQRERVGDYVLNEPERHTRLQVPTPKLVGAANCATLA